MRRKALFLSMIAPLLTFGQIIDELPKDENGNLNYSEVIQAESVSKDDLYLRAKQFFVDVFKSANDVIQMDDKESGIIIGKGFSDIYTKVMGVLTQQQMWYSIKIQSKEGRYKYTIYDIYLKSDLGQYGTITTRPEEIFSKQNYYKKNGKPKDSLEKYKIEIVNKLNSLVTTIKATMNTSATSTENKEEW